MNKSVTIIPKKPKILHETKRCGHKLRVAAYCRVSTDREEQESSLDAQVKYYTDLINGRPDWILVGIYADDGISGTKALKRKEFQRMIRDCQQGKIDLVLTKAISRFARNTVDSIHYTSLLKEYGVGIYFDKENINSLDDDAELVFTIVAALAQEESHNISENCAFGIRENFRRGIPQMHPELLLGYDRGPDRTLVINEEQAAIVRRVYHEFENGLYEWSIADKLNAEGVCGLWGKPSWTSLTINRMLRNEVYKGSLLMQKFYTADYLTRRLVRNDGKLEQYYVANNHPAIIDPDEWEAVQMELDRRIAFRKEHHVTVQGSRRRPYAFFSRVFCANCGGRYTRCSWPDRAAYWTCVNREGKYGATCHNDIIKDDQLREAFAIAWNRIVNTRAERMPSWHGMIENGNPLQRLRARQMQELTAAGVIAEEDPEITRKVLEHADVISKKELAFHFLDGTAMVVKYMKDRIETEERR